MPVVNAVARSWVELAAAVCPVLLMKVVTVCAAACSGATVARTARTASANATGIGARGTRRAAMATSNEAARRRNRGGGRRSGRIAVPISVVSA